MIVGYWNIVKLLMMDKIVVDYDNHNCCTVDFVVDCIDDSAVVGNRPGVDCNCYSLDFVIGLGDNSPPVVDIGYGDLDYNLDFDRAVSDRVNENDYHTSC